MATAYIINYLIPEDAMAENITTAPTSAAAVANAFLDIQELDGGNFPPIDQMKLQKLVYYAYAWWLAYTGQQLFPEDVEAWPWGPVARNHRHSSSSSPWPSTDRDIAGPARPGHAGMTNGDAGYRQSVRRSR
jgi:hypothetical protein